MARKRSPARLLLDTSAVVHLLHAHSLQRAAVREAVAGGQVLVPILDAVGGCPERPWDDARSMHAKP